jgi:DNA-3-methyladenine glycosylase
LIDSMRAPDVLPISFYERNAEEVARDLLGVVLESTIAGVRTAGIIVETEAYVGPHDAASHATERRGRTPRNEPMFGEPGTAYIYLIYGLHWCFNVVTGPVGYPAAVLIRALQPVAGLETMRERRGGQRKDRELASGPGKLAQALRITGALNNHSLHEPPLRLLRGGVVDPATIESGPRIGVTGAIDWPLRFFLAGNPWISQ